MSFSEPARAIDFLRCLLCGHIARVQRDAVIPDRFHTRHEFEARVQEFLGPGKKDEKGTGFAWSSRPLLLDEMIELERVASEIVGRLRHEIDCARAR